MKTQSLGARVAEFERREVLSEIAKAGGDRLAAAQALGVSMATLYRKMGASEYAPLRAQVYLVRNKRANAVKIGFSNSPRLRESVMAAEDPDLELVAAYPGSRLDEKYLHALFKEKRVRGEWFRLDEHDLSKITETLMRK